VVQSIIALGLDRSVVRFLPIFHEQRDYRRLFGTITMTVLVIVFLGLAAALVLYGFQGLIGRWVPDKPTLTVLLILVFLAPVQALDDLLVGLFAVFAKTRAIFVRRFLLAPGLRLLVVVALIASRDDVFLLAVGYLASSLLGVAIYSFLFLRVLRDEGLLEKWSLRDLVMPWRQVLGFTIPLLTTDLVYATMTTLSVVLLGHYWGTTSVAGLRAVQPTAQLNELVMSSFAILFTPLAARMFAKKDHIGINGLYWRTAIWIAIFSFPIFAVTFSFAQPITLLLYGSRYEQFAPILALLSLGYYFNAALGFNGLTLKVYGRVRYTVLINLATVAINVFLSLLLIPRLGVLGAGIGIMVALIIHNLFKQAGLRLGTGVNLFEWRYLRVYLGIALCALGLLAVQITTSASVYLTLGLAVLATVLLIRLNAGMLEVSEMFPEAMRFPGVRLLVSGRRSRDALK